MERGIFRLEVFLVFLVVILTGRGFQRLYLVYLRCISVYLIKPGMVFQKSCNLADEYENIRKYTMAKFQQGNKAAIDAKVILNNPKKISLI